MKTPKQIVQYAIDNPHTEEHNKNQTAEFTKLD